MTSLNEAKSFLAPSTSRKRRLHERNAQLAEPEPASRLKEQFDILGIVFNCFLAQSQMRLIPPCKPEVTAGS